MEVEHTKCIWEGSILRLPCRLVGTAVLDDVNVLLTPISTLKYRLALVRDDGTEVLSCRRCIHSGMTSPLMYRRLCISQGQANHPILEYDILVTCCGSEYTREHRGSGRASTDILGIHTSYRLFVELYML